MQPPEARLGLLDRVLIVAAVLFLRLLGASARYRVEGAEALEARLAAGGRVILATWHGSMLLGEGYFRRYRPTVMTSLSRDGELISRTALRLGWSTVRGSSSRGGARAFVQLARQLAGGAVVAHVVDGPRGPARQIKPGLLALAQRAEAAIALVSLAARPKIQVGSWDRMQIPLPFSRIWVRVVLVEPPPPELGPEALEVMRQDVEKRFERESELLEGRRRRAAGSE